MSALLPDLMVYTYDACPFCARVRAALDTLRLDALIKPCPRGGERFRAEALAHGGKLQFPYLHDAAGDRSLYDSGAIVAYLYERADAGTPPAPTPLPPFDPSSLDRPAPGRDARPSRAPAQPLHLWEPAGAPDTEARRVLCELELAYVHRVRPPDAPDAPPALSRGAVLHDPNRGASPAGSAAICAYLEDVYGG